MTVLELLEELTEIGATVTSDGDQVAVCFPEERRFEVQALGPEIRRLKPELLRTVAERNVRPSTAAPESPLQGFVHGRLVTMTPAPAECPPLPPGVRLVKYSPKCPPVGVSVCSVVINVARFISRNLEDLDARLNHPAQMGVGDSVPETLAKLAEVGLELALDRPTQPTRGNS
jgi:hypothetical protein